MKQNKKKLFFSEKKKVGAIVGVTIRALHSKAFFFSFFVREKIAKQTTTKNESKVFVSSLF